MDQNKSVLLIGGGGTLGTYTAKTLLDQGCRVDIICLEDRVPDREGLRFIKAKADAEFLEGFFRDKSYDGIVNFIHYPDVSVYPPVHEILIAHTKHLIVLSSYRVYADEQHPVTETAPKLLDVSDDRDFVENEKYAISKAKLERFLFERCKGQCWTVVRPVISFSKNRLDLVTYSRRIVLNKTKNGEVIPLPDEAKDLTAGLDWAGNSGKLIASLLFKEETFGEAFTVSSAQNRT
jgi:nucleoside-diphosphate-sugar epimerase